MSSSKLQQAVLYSTDSAVIQDAAYRDVKLFSKRPDSWSGSQVLFVWISDAAARDQALDSVKHDLFQLAKRSSCGVALFHAVVAKLQDIKEAWDEAGQHARYSRDAEYQRRINDYNTGKAAFDKWIKRWGIQTSFIKQKDGLYGGNICSMETVITPRDDSVMATLQPYRTKPKPTLPSRQNSQVGQRSPALKAESRKGSVASQHSGRRGSQGGVLL